jgi:alkylation response protein AidB-like acyl-CoA dehydrogenase
MNLLFSDEQTQIIDSLSGFLADRAPVSRFRPPAAQIGNRDRDFLPHLGALGFLGIALPEARGGIGLSAAEEMLAFREFGRHLLSPSVLGLTLGARAAARADSPLLAAALSGELAVGLANARGSVHVGAECSGEFHLFDAKDASWVLICAQEGTALLRRADFLDVTTVLGTDHVIGLERGRLAGARPAIWVDAASEAIHVRAQLLLAAYAVGIGEATRDMAVDYAKNRQQFGRPIGAFQAIKHLCADMAIRSEAALCQVIFAALIQAEERGGADFHTVSAKLVAVDAALKNAASNIQVHGAIGFTAETDAHSFLKRAHVIEQLWGDTRQQRRRMLAAAFPLD